MNTQLLSSLLVLISLTACGTSKDIDDLDTDTGDDIADPLDGIEDPRDDTTDPSDDSDLATRYMERGSLAVGYTVLEHPRLDADPLVVKAWYPARAKSNEEVDYSVPLKLEGFGGGNVRILGDAALDATPDAAFGPYPLVVLSHGFALNPEWYHQLAEHLASHGFVVLGPEHNESAWFTDVVGATTARPTDIGETIDLAAAGALDGIIDTEHVAVIGHSYGGYTALAAAGARIDTWALAERCAEVTDEFAAAYFCGPFLAGEADLADAMGLDSVPQGLWPSMGDSRVDAILPISSNAYLFGEEGLAQVTVPTMLLGGTADTSAPWDWSTGLAYDNVSSVSLTQVALEGAEHFIPVTTCDHMPWTENLPEDFYYYVCEDPAWDKPDALTIINQLSTAFLLSNLADNTDARASLDPSLYLEVEGITMTVVAQ